MKVSFTKAQVHVLILLILLLSVCDLMAQELTISERVAARITGPFHWRLLLQPLVAIILGIKDGKADAKNNRPPYIFEIFTNKADRKANLKNALNSIFKPLVVGIVLDAVVQILLFRSLRIWGACVVGAVLIGIPYALARGLRNRASNTKLNGLNGSNRLNG